LQKKGQSVILYKNNGGRRVLYFSKTVTEKQARLMNPVVLAFVGDAVYTLFTRTKAAVGSDKKANELNRESAKTVSAIAQAKRVDELLSVLTEEELSIFKRARNAKKSTRAKNASVSQYHKSTGFEAVLGYLYLTGQNERLSLLLREKESEGTEDEN
jgi:ribonuclease-3 family protein